MNLFRRSQPVVIRQTAPAPRAPRIIPTADDTAVRDAARQQQLSTLSRAGRASTILTTPSDREYSRRTLG